MQDTKPAPPHGSYARYNKRGCRCGECRLANTAYNQQYRAQRAAEGRPVRRPPAPVGECLKCGGVVHRGALRCKPCGHSHRRSMRRRREAATIRMQVAAAGTRGRVVWVQGPCAECGAMFAPSPGVASRYCSPTCRRVARSGAKWISRTARLAIYASANWACQICGDQMSAEYRSDDIWSPTLDHIVPRSQGGSDHPDNLRACHMWCNSVRGDLTFHTDADLQLI